MSSIPTKGPSPETRSPFKVDADPFHIKSNEAHEADPFREARPEQKSDEAAPSHESAKPGPSNFSKTESHQVPNQRENFGQKLQAHFASAAEKIAEHLTDQDLPSSRETVRSQSAKIFQELSPRAERGLKSILADKIFKGTLKDSPLHQKLNQQLPQASNNNSLTQQISKNPEPLSKGELLQLFRMRHKLEEKQETRSFIREKFKKENSERRERVNAMRQRADKGGRGDEVQGSRSLTLRKEKQLLDEKFSRRLEEGETAFEIFLKQAMEGEAAVPDLPFGSRPRLPIRNSDEWKKLFNLLLSLNSEMVETNTQLGNIREALYRGLYSPEGAEIPVVISDLALFENGEITESKFAQILLKDKDLATLFRDLKPGDLIHDSLLRQLGEEIAFIKLLHVVPETVLSEEQKNAMLKNFRSQVPAHSRDKLESALMRHRERGEKNPAPNPGAAYAKNPDPIVDTEGRPKIIMGVVYTIITAAIILGIVLAFN